MLVKSVQLTHYRNYPDLSMDPAPGINLLYGDNAQGKTNLLEALYLCATSSSHRGSRDKDLIAFGEDQAHIRLMVEKGGITTRIDLHVSQDNKREAAVNGIALKKISELPGHFHVVFFSPEDLKIIKNAPVERRSFLNVELCQLSRSYTRDLVAYKRALLQRNALLKEMRMGGESLGLLLDAYDERLSDTGERLMKARQSFMEEMEEVVSRIHQKITEGKESLSVKYQPGARIGRMEEGLKENRERDIALGSTGIGPQRDELEFKINGIDVKRFGSQGQQRTAALSVKLGEIELVKGKLGEPPVLLLDDVLSELDAGRQEKLLRIVEGTQTFLTCTGLDDFVRRSVQAEKKWRVLKGSLTEEDI